MSDNAKELKLTLKVNGKDQEFVCNYATEATDKFHTKYNFVVEGDLFAALEQIAYLSTKGKYKVEGFRNGKAPKSTIERVYGKGVWLEETVDGALDHTYSALMQTIWGQEALIARPDYKVESVELGKVSFSFTTCVMPDFTATKYTGIKVAKVSPESVKSDAIDAEIQKAREKLGCWQEIDNRAVESGDTVNIDYSGSIDGVKFEGGTAEKQDLVIGSNTFIPGFEIQLIGMNIGDEKDIKVTFPDDYGAKELAGKDAIFAIKLHGIKVKELPELDDDFVKDATDDCDTVKQYKAKIKKELEEKAVKNAERATESKLVEKLAELNPIEFPEEYYDIIAEQAIRQQFEQQGIPVDMYLKYVKTTLEQMVKEYKESESFHYAVDDEKVRIIMTAIVKQEKIVAEDSEVEAKIAEYATKANKSVEDYKKDMKAGEKDYIANVVVNEKLRNYLLKNNTIK